jgi:hypothetical protein
MRTLHCFLSLDLPLSPLICLRHQGRKLEPHESVTPQAFTHRYSPNVFHIVYRDGNTFILAC